MSATIALVRIQLHFLKWPLVVLTACVIALVIPIGLPKDAIEVFSATFVIIGAVVSGAMVFGEEYVHGAKDYMATRPVAPMHVLSVKVLMLLTYSIPAAVIVDDGFSFLHPYWRTIEYERMVPLVWGLLFGLSLWCAGAAILTKDSVRGMLYGPPTYFMACVIVWLLPSPFYQDVDEIKTWPGKYVNIPYGWNDLCNLYNDFFVIGLICLSPLLILGMVICVYRSTALQRLSIPISATILFLFYMGAYTVAFHAVHVDCVPTTQGIPEDTIIGIDQVHGTIYAVDDQRIYAPTREVIVRSLHDPKHDIRSFKRILIQYPGRRIIKDFIHRGHFYVEYGKNDKGISFLDSHVINDQGELEDPIHIEAEGIFDYIRYFDDNHILAKDYILDASGNVDNRLEARLKSPTKLIDLCTGTVEACTKESRTLSGYGSWGRLFLRQNRIEEGNEIRDIDTTALRIKYDLSLEKITTIPFEGGLGAFDDNILAFIPSIKVGKRWKACKQEVTLWDFRDVNEPKGTILNLPIGFFLIPRTTLSLLSYLGFNDRDMIGWTLKWDMETNIFTGNGILGVQYFNRMALWEISNPEQPIWLGIARFDGGDVWKIVSQGYHNYPQLKEIIRYPDGTIGFPISEWSSKILRYEFPALMKEAKS